MGLHWGEGKGTSIDALLSTRALYCTNATRTRAGVTDPWVSLNWLFPVLYFLFMVSILPPTPSNVDMQRIHDSPKDVEYL